MVDIIEREAKTGTSAYQTWSSRLKHTLWRRQKHWNGDAAWRQAKRLVAGHHYRGQRGPNLDASSDNPNQLISVNLTGSAVEDFVPFLVRRMPEFVVSPTRPEFVDSAKNQQDLLNYSWRKLRMQRPMKRVVRDSVVFGHGVIKTGYRLELDETKVKADGRVDYHDFVRADEPFIQRINPFHFLFDLDAPEHDLESSRWAANMVFRPVQDILTTERYSRKVRDRIANGRETLQTIPMQGLEDEEGEFSRFPRSLTAAQEYGILWELWDKKFEKYFVFGEGIEDPLVESGFPYTYLDGFPYVMLNFIEIPDEPYALGLPRWVVDQQLEINRLRSKQYNHHRRSSRQYQGAREFITPREAEKFERGEDMALILTEGGPGEPVITPIPDAPMSIDSDRIQALIMNDFSRMTGHDALVSGAALPSRTSATEVQARGQFFGLKLEERTENVDRFYTETGGQVLKHLRANLTRERAIKVLGDGIGSAYAESQFKTITRRDIDGEFDLEITSVSGDKPDPEVSKQQKLQMVQILLQQAMLLMQLQIPISWVELIRYMLTQFDDVQDVGRFFLPAAYAPPPLVEQKPAPSGQDVSLSMPDPAASKAQPGPPMSSHILGALTGMQSMGANGGNQGS